jgi:GNAT superfamily N-acetyltransferase
MNSPVSLRAATHHDGTLLGRWNVAIIREEGHRNAMTESELKTRMQGWIASGEYRVHMVIVAHESVGYICWRAEGLHEIVVRQCFVAPPMRRQGIGRSALALLKSDVWPKSARISVDVLATNSVGIAFWRACGFADYSARLEQLPEHSTNALR